MIRLNFERWQLRATADRPVPVYENPGSPRPVTNITKDTIVTTIGVPLDHSPDGVDYSYRAVIVNTAALDKIGNRKIGFIRRPAGDPMPTEAAWDAAIMKALFDPSFRGGEVIDATEAQIAAAKKEGALSALASADAAIENLKGGL